MKDATPQAIKLSEYKVLPYFITDIHLTFELDSTATKVTSRMHVVRNEKSKDTTKDLHLNGEELKFVKATLDGVELGSDRVVVQEEGLVVKDVPDSAELVIENIINPEANKALDGLYKSGDIFCTQNEPEGFRRITYYIDRPDNMAKFTTRIIADKEKYPVLLSNGNPIAEGDLDNGLHYVEWEDPFFKPCYLYALVAGDLGLVQSSYNTMSGREIDLRIYCDKGNESKCHHAMESLKKSMKWDEDTFGLEYDLDIYMIVAVDAFNMGAMENKGLNIFNSVYVLADETTATDANFLGIESVVGHEYFHNWTGNRITCRDWFQLTLKEGLTVFRDQEFSSDLNDRTVQRIQDVERLKTMQFVEDAGPTSHPIKPTTYIEINNFYTATIYEKGAEVIRMVRTLLGKEGFRKGMDKYFELFDGQAVTTEDFIHAMSVANGDYDFEQFKNWYAQAGTPDVEASWEYIAEDETLTLVLRQSCRPTAENAHKKPYFFPFAIGLLDSEGKDMPLNLKESEGQTQLREGVLHVSQPEQTFTFTGVKSKPVLSLNRGFTAPVKLHVPYELSDLAFILANDSDLYNRYEAMQTLVYRLVFAMSEDLKSGPKPKLGQDFVQAYGTLLKDRSVDPAIKALLINIPSVALLAQGHNPISFERIIEARKIIRDTLATTFKDTFVEIYNENETPGEYKLDPLTIGKRALRNKALSFLGVVAANDDAEMTTLIVKHFESATNMTDEISGLTVLGNVGGEAFDKASSDFYNKWKDQTLVMQKWLTVHGGVSGEDFIERITKLEGDAVYDKNVPNLVRALIGAVSRNLKELHHESGRGYQFMADKVLEMDKINPQVASRLVSCFKDYKRLEAGPKALLEKELKRIVETDGLSKNVFEIASKTLK